MLIQERYNRIIELLKKDQCISVRKLSKELYASEATIRRDLKHLSEIGQIRRTFGGATLVEGMHSDVPLVVRNEKYSREKKIIAALAASLIRDDDVIIIDSSSTCFNMIPYLEHKSNTVITNSPRVALALSNYPKLKVYSTGGYVLENAVSYVGSAAESMMHNCNCDIMFFSSGGISSDNQITDTNEEETRLKKVMIQHSKKIVALHDSSKLDKVAFSIVCSLDDIDVLVTDRYPGAAWESLLKEHHVHLLCPENKPGKP
ncbi:DeoR/GlpR family DNA-binding transcription regulator [Christensenella tenuis]|jgi:DeoR/GlpR family transcriptional regulator of sugar metabolism|uniref:DeoR/GlpR transcriptional regulator n=1 Tax=Christensenella tenuis TaxID=2763033 RepID=A0ABR7EFW6_9FIRM|nr:DeoR/GlpR family DNA-binding transcription regulator [Christensenella tenuis]MBC5648657.1 DeoR/GlpR transcriptional regulator [Christensenella tenuis]